MLKAFANAKINLLLDITGREENGYHTVNNIMQTVSLQDTVTLSCDCEGIKLEYSDGYPVSDKDICLKAATEYQRAAGRKINAEIKIEKLIPTAAGLGGNSSAAAAVLVLLSRQYGFLSEEEIYKIAASLGADVPFFLSGGTALCEHYGEVIKPLPDCPEVWVVIAKKGVKSSTAEMYKRIDELEPCERGNLWAMLSALKSNDIDSVCSNAFNLFEAVWQEGGVDELKKIMITSGAKVSMLSGSGPAVFGLFATEEQAKEACEQILASGTSAYLCKTERVGILVE